MISFTPRPGPCHFRSHKKIKEKSTANWWLANVVCGPQNSLCNMCATDTPLSFAFRMQNATGVCVFGAEGASKPWHRLSCSFRLPQSISIYQFLQSTDFINFMALFKTTQPNEDEPRTSRRWAGTKRTCHGGNLTASRSRKEKYRREKEKEKPAKHVNKINKCRCRFIGISSWPGFVLFLLGILARAPDFLFPVQASLRM